MSGPGLDVAAVMNTLTARRQALGKSQQDIADKVGISVRSVTSYEIAERTPTLETVACMARALGMKVTVEAVE